MQIELYITSFDVFCKVKNKIVTIYTRTRYTNYFRQAGSSSYFSGAGAGSKIKSPES